MTEPMVYIVGAGVGRIQDLTLKAKNTIETADIIFFDRLVNPNLLLLTQPTCQLIDVGKKPGDHRMTQQQINQAMIDASQQYQTVVRLKSGDPYVFGRGGEEAIELGKAGIKFEIVAGISSPIAGLMYAGIPITYRGHALDFHIFTSHSQKGEVLFDWDAMVKLGGTLVFMMGVKSLPTIVESLIESGKAKETPIAIIEWASRAGQKTLTSTLGEIQAHPELVHVKPPSVIAVGEVVKFRDYLNFFEEKPLFGQRIAIPQTQTHQLLAQLEAQGAEVVLYESLVEESNVITQETLNSAKLIIFTDLTAIDQYIQWMIKQQVDWRTNPDVHYISVGNHVQSGLQSYGIAAQVHYEAVDHFMEHYKESVGMFILGKHYVKQQMLEQGWEFDLAEFIVTSQESKRLLTNHQALLEADVLIFPNERSVRSFSAYLEESELLCDQFLQKQTIVLGNRAYGALSTLGFQHIKQTVEPNFNSLLTLLIENHKGEEG